jgi:hypothetical protein
MFKGVQLDFLLGSALMKFSEALKCAECPVA